jgi:hypothetical protein
VLLGCLPSGEFQQSMPTHLPRLDANVGEAALHGAEQHAVGVVGTAARRRCLQWLESREGIQNQGMSGVVQAVQTLQVEES